MGITEEVNKNQGIKEKIKDNIQSPRLMIKIKYYLLIIGYWGMTFILHNIYNKYRLEKYRKILFERVSNPSSLISSSHRAFRTSNLIIIIAISLTLLLIAFNSTIRRLYFFILADAALLFCTIAEVVKHTANIIKKSFCLIYRHSK